MSRVPMQPRRRTGPSTRLPRMAFFQKFKTWRVKVQPRALHATTDALRTRSIPMYPDSVGPDMCRPSRRERRICSHQTCSALGPSSSLPCMGHRQRLRQSSMHRLQLAPALWCGCYACWGSPLVWQRTSNRTVSSRREPMPATRTARKYARCIRVHLRGGFRLYSLSKSHSAWLPVRRKHRILEPRHHLFGEGTRRPGDAYDYVQHHRWPLALPLTPHIWPHDRPPHRHRGPLLRSCPAS